MKNLKLIFITISLALVSLISSSPVDLNAQGFSPWEIEKIVGKNAPDFTLRDLSGNNVSLSSFKGKPILLNIWATWCPYCREERPQLNSLYKEYNDKGLVVIAVSVDRSVEKVRRYLKKIRADYIILMDEDGIVARRYGVFALPTSFLIGKDGKIEHKFMGMRRWTSSNSKRLIEELIEG